MPIKTVFIERLKQEIRQMSHRSQVYKLLKTELSVLGYWRNKARGNPPKGFKAGWGKKRYINPES